MGYNQASLLGVVALTLLATVAQGQLLNNILSNVSVTGLNVSGIIKCPPSGLGLPFGPGLSGVTVSLYCSNLLGVAVPVAQTVTGLGGVYNFNLPRLNQTMTPLFGGLLPCTVRVNLPINNTVCPVLNTVRGTLTGVVVLVGTVLNQLGGLLGNAMGALTLSLNLTI